MLDKFLDFHPSFWSAALQDNLWRIMFSRSPENGMFNLVGFPQELGPLTGWVRGQTQGDHRAGLTPDCATLTVERSC